MKIKKLTKENIFKISELLSDEVYDYKHYSERQELTVKFYKILKNKLKKKGDTMT